MSDGREITALKRMVSKDEKETPWKKRSNEIFFRMRNLAADATLEQAKSVASRIVDPEKRKKELDGLDSGDEFSFVVYSIYFAFESLTQEERDFLLEHINTYPEEASKVVGLHDLIKYLIAYNQFRTQTLEPLVSFDGYIQAWERMKLDIANSRQRADLVS